jgi:ABC-type multidrug transport system ATPase subunit
MDTKEGNVTNAEVIARGYSCWLQDARETENRPESTYGALMLYGASGGHVVMVNTSAVNTVPIMLNVRANALLQKLKPDDEIRMTFSQFDRTPNEFGEALKNFFVILSILILSVALAFPPPFFVAFIVEEKASGMKGQLLVSGLRGMNYWVANYIFDILPWFVALSLLTLTFWSYDLELYFENDVFPIFATAQIAFVAHIVPFAYCMAQLFSDPANAIMVVLIFGIFYAVLYVFWIIFMFDGGGGEDSWRALSESWTPYFRMHPTFTFSETMIVMQQLKRRFDQSPPDMVTDNEKKQCLDDRAQLKNLRWDCTYSYWEWDACGGPIYSMLMWGFGLLFVVVGIEVLYQTPSAIFSMQKPKDRGTKVAVTEDEEDDAVRGEAAKVDSGQKTGPIHVQGVRKTYVSGNIRASKFTAVKKISWACEAGDVFGLLGVNGAGKTTLFQMLSGILVQNEGAISIAGNNMLDSNGLKKARNVIGYCPQHNPLLAILTVREHLEMYGMLKGLSGPELTSARDLWIAAMDLKSHAHKLAGNLSGGNKRKLCVAIAMIGDPEIILLDEPSAGMDPEARRFMWNVIAEIAQTRKQATVVLTTHSMEECEALCNKITIMVNGSFRCFGTHKEVKDLYGAGRMLSLKLENATKEELLALQEKWTADGLVSPASAAGAQETATRITREKLVKWAAERDDPWISEVLASPVAPFPEPTPESLATITVLSEWYCNARNAKKLLGWVKDLDDSSEWLAWASTTFRFKLYGGGSLPSLFDNMYKNKARLKMMEYAVSPTSLEQIFHTFAKEQTGAEGNEQGVYGNEKEKALTSLFASIDGEAASKNVESVLAVQNVSEPLSPQYDYESSPEVTEVVV